MTFKRSLDTPSLSDALDAAVAAGVGAEDSIAGAAALSALRETQRPIYDRLDDWAKGGLERIVNNYESGLDADPQDAEFLMTMCAIATRTAKQTQD